MDFALTGRVALVTGGGRGIGRAVALTLAAQGVDIALCGRTQETLDRTAADLRALGVRAFPIQADVAQLANIERFVAEAHRQAGRIDILVNNAGVTDFTKQLANQVAPCNVTVNCVHPGMTQTERMTANLERRAADAGVSIEEMTAPVIAEIPIGRLIRPEDIANAVLFYCSPLADAITGQAIAVDGGSAMSVNY